MRTFGAHFEGVKNRCNLECLRPAIIGNSISVYSRIRGYLRKVGAPLTREAIMRSIIIATTVTLLSSSALTQQPNQRAASVPDFSGIWSHPYVFGFELPPSGPGPVVNKARRRQIFDADGRPLPPANAPLVSDQLQLIGDYTNPILKPEAAEVVKKHGEISLTGVAYPTPSNQFGPQGCLSFFCSLECRCSSSQARSRYFTLTIMNSARCA